MTIKTWDNFEAFAEAHNEERFKLFTTKVSRSYTEARYRPGDYLVFGKETKGLPEQTRRMYSDLCYTLPMANCNIRSLNLAMTAGIVLYEALRQQNC